MGHPSGEVQLGPETDTALSRWPAVISSESVLDTVAAIPLLSGSCFRGQGPGWTGSPQTGDSGSQLDPSLAPDPMGQPSLVLTYAQHTEI